MIFCANVETTMSFDELRTKISLESSAAAPQTILSIFSSLIPKANDLISSISASLKPVSDQNTENEESVTVKTARYKKIVEKTQQLPYSAYRNMLIMVPEGFSGNLAEYLKILIKIRSGIIRQAERVLSDYEIQLAMFLNETQARTSVENYAAKNKELDKERKAIEVEIAKHFSDRDTRSRVQFGKVVSRFSELGEIFAYGEVISKLKVNSDLEKLISQTNHINDMFKLIQSKIDKNEINAVSGQAAKNISEGAFQAAKFLELTSIVVFNTQIMAAVIDNLALQMEKIVSN